jgi:UDP-N-acetylmuramate dehydrogenase
VSFTLEQARPLAPLTSLGLGGPAAFFVRATEREDVRDALRWAAHAGKAVGVLGGGSNLVVSDAGFEGLVIHMQTRGVELVREGDAALLTVQAGEPWQHVVELALAENLAGVECLTGIPGSTGATPIQNVGAYGQEVQDSIAAVEVLERETLTTRWLPHDACGFAYRDSRFKRAPGEFVVLAVRYRLVPGGAPCVRYPELARALGPFEAAPSLQQVASAVRALRAQKSMLLNPHDQNGRSAGSFFVNPVVPDEVARAVAHEALVQELVARVEDMPAFAAGPGLTKLSAGWLIERAGLAKGTRCGAVGLSTQHALCLVHHGGGSTGELLAFAAHIKARVREVFGVELVIEPVRW